MKKTISLKIAMVAGFLSMSVASNAQTTQNVTLNVLLTNLTSLVINPANIITALPFILPTDYSNGVSQTQLAAMTAISTQPYSISLYASGDMINGASSIPVSDVTVTPSLTLPLGTVTCTGHPIPTGAGNAVQIVHSTAGSLLQVFNLDYSTVGAPAQDFINKPGGLYSTTLTYTITNP